MSDIMESTGTRRSMVSSPEGGRSSAPAQADQEARVRNDNAAGAALAKPTTPKISVPTDENRKGRTLQVKASVENLNFYYGQHHALKNLTIPIADKQVTALIGPSGCGKSTFLRCFNRMHDLQPDTRYEGSITLYPDNLNLVGANVDPIEVRMRIGMVFQKPNPFPKSIFDGVARHARPPAGRLPSRNIDRCTAFTDHPTLRSDETPPHHPWQPVRRAHLRRDPGNRRRVHPVPHALCP